MRPRVEASIRLFHSVRCIRVLVIAEVFWLSSRTLRAMMREVGRVLAKNYIDRSKSLSRPERIEVALAVLHDLGGSARFDKTGGKQFIYGHNGCPLAAVTASHPHACLIVESLLSEIIGIPAKKCCQYGDRPRCCFELSANLILHET